MAVDINGDGTFDVTLESVRLSALTSDDAVFGATAWRCEEARRSRSGGPFNARVRKAG